VGESLLVEAGAGTGKTTSLVGRVVEVLASGQATVDEIALITFTHKAAAELSARVREGLEEAVEAEGDEERRERLASAIRGLYRARVETIHSFATALLRERPVEAGLDPEFHALDELEGDLLFGRLFEDWLADLLAEPRPEVETAINLGVGPDELKAAAEIVHEHRYLLPLEPFDLPTTSGREVEKWLDANIAEIASLEARVTNEDSKALPHMRRLLAFPARLEIEGTTKAARMRLFARDLPWVSTNAGAKGDWEDPGDCPRWKELAGEWRQICEKVPVETRSVALTELLPLIEEFVRSYEQHRRSEGLADFDDLIIWSRDLLRDRPEVRDYFRKRFKVLMIDEFQDTDPIQVELAMLISSEGESRDWRKLAPVPGKLFLVGDPKQSIYRFRRADISVYDEVKAGPLNGALRNLVQNFRSVPGVIEWVNETFDRLFEERPGLQPKNVRLEASGFEQGLARPPVMVMRGRYPDAKIGELRRHESEAVASTLHGAVDGVEAWPVRDRVTGELRTPEWRDIAILLPRRTGLEAYEEALAAVGVPYRHEGSRDYFEREEIRDLVHLLSSIDDPRDRVSLIGALRSGAFGCSDDDLVIHAATADGFPWDYRRKVGSESERVTDAFGFLRQLHYARQQLSLPLLVQRVVAESRLVEVALTGRDGAQAAANLLAIVDQARAFTSAGGGSPRAFVRWLADNTESERSEVDAGISEETDDVVRIMTMHGAKGLEFPIVVLGGLAGKPQGSSRPVPDEADSRLHFYVGKSKGASNFPTPGYSERWDKEREALGFEDVRLLYVAATRARDHLVIPDFTGKDSPGPLLEKLSPLLPEGDAHKEEVDGVWMVDAERIERPVQVEEKRAKVKAADAKAAIAERKTWETGQRALIDEARKGLELEVASSVERSVRPMAAEASHSDAAMLVSEGPPLEIGDALHKVMEKVSLPEAEDLEPWARAVCAEFGIPEHEHEVVELARRCLASPSFERAKKSGAPIRELPIATVLNGSLALGRSDLVFRTEDCLVIVDYKTDQIGASDTARHSRKYHAAQAEMYSTALLSSGAAKSVHSVVLVYPRADCEVILSPESLTASLAPLS
jgi:ATP-dependent helicase/nuclease subunit A